MRYKYNIDSTYNVIHIILSERYLFSKTIQLDTWIECRMKDNE